ncbi:unnamed protein product [Cylindrotheca closterium]|uniref:Hexosyltransferase n=1 Tax=Cylindrotheca closterium TaxID=2856 RepID=A0AAD2FVA1_9STRA|nr:unnamed protein product [Cylindrotheca closterium]
MTGSMLKRTVVVSLAALILVALRRQALLLDRSLPQWTGDNVDAEGHHLSQSSVSSLFRQTTSAEPARRKWAYAFVVGGCSKHKPEYRGFIWNIAVAAQVLQETGSQADVVALIQMSARTNETALPEDESKLLEALNVKIEYIPKFSSMVHEVFYTLMLEKFRILQMTQYSRVIFMDGDVMPLCSLDYLFELSEPESGEPLLKDNIVISYSNQPAHGGFFMLHPQESDYEEIQKIIKTTEEKALSLPPFEHWDEVEGWGHIIEPPDRWMSSMSKFTSTNWSWHGVHADQGLLYHWTKYVKQSVSLIINYQVQNWGSENGTAVMEKAFINYRPSDPINIASCHTSKNAPYTDFRHFTGRGKPWQQNSTQYITSNVEPSQNREEVTKTFDQLVSSLNGEMRSNGKEFDGKKLLSTLMQMVPPQGKEAKTPAHAEKGNNLSYSDQSYVKWFNALDKAQRISGVNVTFPRYFGRNFARGPPVGTYPKFKERIRHIRWKVENGWNPYSVKAETTP